MKNTANYGWPHPEPGDHTRTWEYWDAFNNVDTDLKSVDGTARAAYTAVTAAETVLKSLPQMYADATTVSVANGATSATRTVTIGNPFAANPSVATDIQDSPGAISGWISRAITINPASFTIILMGTAASSAQTINVNWIAMQRLTFKPPPGMPPPGTPQNPPQPPEGWHYVTATCHTNQCPRKDVPVPDVLIPDVPEDWGWNGVQCGACHQPITDLVPQ